MGFPCGSAGKESSCHSGDLGWEDPWRRERLPTPKLSLNSRNLSLTEERQAQRKQLLNNVNSSLMLTMMIHNKKTEPSQRDGMGREEGGGFRMGNTYIPVADSF